MTHVSIRRFQDTDAEATARVFFDAVRRGTAGFYDRQQREAWAPGVPETTDWRSRLNSQSVFVAESGGEIIGFMTVRPDGYVDLAFVAPDWAGTGVGGSLYSSVESEAMALGANRLHTQASLAARPFFERRGWSVVKAQTVERGGVTLENFVMEKPLT